MSDKKTYNFDREHNNPNPKQLIPSHWYAFSTSQAYIPSAATTEIIPHWSQQRKLLNMYSYNLSDNVVA